MPTRVKKMTGGRTDRRKGGAARAASGSRPPSGAFTTPEILEIIDKAADGVLVADAATQRFVWGNRAICAMIGRTFDEVVTLGVNELHPAADLPRVKDIFRRQAAGEFTLGPDIPLLRADGAILMTDVNSYPIQLGGRAHLVGVFRDATGRKAHERALRETEVRFRELAELLPVAIFEMNREGTLTFVNRAAFDAFRYRPEDFRRGLRNIDMIAPGDRARAAENGRIIMRGTIFGVGEYTALRADGTTFPCVISSSPIIHDGVVAGLRGVVIDITERKRMERELAAARDEFELRVLERTAELIAANRALRESEEKFRGLFESSRDAIMTLEPPTWRFTSGNAATVRVFRAKSAAEFVSYEPWRLSPERQPDGRASSDKAREMIETAMREGSHFFEWAHKRIDGEEFPASVLLTRMEQAGKTFLQATVRDLTEHKRLERQAIQSEKMAAVGTLIAGLSHELNNPLGTIIGYAQSVLHRLPDGSPLRGPLEAIERESRRSATLVRSLLDFSRRDPAERQPADPAAILASIRGLGAGPARAAGVAYEAPEPAGVLPAIFVCVSEIESAVFNLVVNALDATPAGGRVTVTCARAALGGRPGVVFTVADNGVGIADTHLPRIFEPFFTTKPPGKGTGLGLSIVRQITDVYGGRVNVATSPSGTTMDLWIPAAADGNKVLPSVPRDPAVDGGAD